ncbi:MAG TPA: hypothetical protein VHS97_19245, partial [Isosphaeraceae bacterium]|nr:hypothetical protein [Isosphaeraceae bacterium]
PKREVLHFVALVCLAQTADVPRRLGEQVKSTRSPRSRVGLGTGGVRQKAAVGAMGRMRRKKTFACGER